MTSLVASGSGNDGNLGVEKVELVMDWGWGWSVDVDVGLATTFEAMSAKEASSMASLCEDWSIFSSSEVVAQIVVIFRSPSH